MLCALFQKLYNVARKYLDPPHIHVSMDTGYSEWEKSINIFLEQKIRSVYLQVTACNNSALIFFGHCKTYHWKQEAYTLHILLPWALKDSQYSSCDSSQPSLELAIWSNTSNTPLKHMVGQFLHLSNELPASHLHMPLSVEGFKSQWFLPTGRESM